MTHSEIRTIIEAINKALTCLEPCPICKTLKADRGAVCKECAAKSNIQLKKKLKAWI